LSPFFKNISKLLSVNIGVAIVAALLSPILTRIYTPEEFGAAAVFMTITGILITIATGRYEFAILLPKNDEKALQLLKLSFLTTSITTLFSAVIFYFFKDYLSEYFNIADLSQWIWICSPTVFLMAGFQIFSAYFNRTKHYTTLATSQGINGLSNPLVKIALGFQNFIKFGLVSGYALAVLTGFIFSLLRFLKLKKPEDNNPSSIREVAGEYKQFPLFNMPHALSNFVSGNLPFIMLVPAFGDFTLGLYSVAITVVFKPVSLLGNTIYQVFSQKTVEDHHLSKAVYSETKKLLLKMIALGIVPFAAAMLFAPKFFGWYFGTDYMLAGEYLQYILPWLFMVYITSPISFIPNLFKQQAKAFAIDLIYLILRFAVLALGIYFDNFELALLLYSGVGVVVLLFYQSWCLHLLKKSEQGLLKIE
jgi:lipopolysaccharide exporter